jgi:superfamily I DNA/RNA helicase
LLRIQGETRIAMQISVIFGPPGTGKTTELSRLIRQYVTAEGSDSVLVCAYTKTAANELAGRDLSVDAGFVGTLHSHCYQALDCPRIAETFYKEWNEAYPVYTLSPQKTLWGSDEPQQRFQWLGDECLNEVNALRHRMIPSAHWPSAALAFWKAWTGWKDAHGYYDFTDLIDKARTLLPVAPGRPSTLIVDEAQDLSLLQWELLQQWSKHCARFISAGDDDQALYRWAGADYRPLLAIESRRVLPQSYRVPETIQQWAMQYTAHLSQRQPKIWAARDEAGTVSQEAGTWEYARLLLASLDEWVEPWGTCAFIAPCAYMLEPLINALEEHGLPFGNRWRRANHRWNPLAPPSKGVGILQRFLDFLRPTDRLWTWQELATWIPLVRSDGVLTRGAKTKVAARADETQLCTMEDLMLLFQQESLAGALQGGLAWLESQALQSKAQMLTYPLSVYRKYGRQALTDEPPIIVGTAHSLKGAEADTVIFFNALSRSQQVALYEGGDDADDIYRMRYVACTRARQALYIIGWQAF